MRNLSFSDIVKTILVILAIPIAVVLGIRFYEVLTTSLVSTGVKLFFVTALLLVVLVIGGTMVGVSFYIGFTSSDNSHKTAGKTAYKVIKASNQPRTTSPEVSVEVKSPDVQVLGVQGQQIPNQLPEHNNKRLVS